MTIPKPYHPRSHPDRFNECQRAVEDRMLELLGDAQLAGWSKDEILAAMIEVAENTMAVHPNVLLLVETELRKLRKKRDL